MPDIFDQIHAQSKGDIFDRIHAKNQALPEQKETGETFLGELGKSLNPIAAAQGLVNTALHPIDTLEAIGNSSLGQARKAKEAFQQGRYSEAVGHGLSTIPVIGPAVSEAGETIGGTPPKMDKYGNVIESGNAPNLGAGIGKGVGAAVGAIIPSRLSKVPLNTPAIPSLSGAVSAAKEYGPLGEAIVNLKPGSAIKEGAKILINKINKPSPLTPRPDPEMVSSGAYANPGARITKAPPASPVSAAEQEQAAARAEATRQKLAEIRAQQAGATAPTVTPPADITAIPPVRPRFVQRVVEKRAVAKVPPVAVPPRRPVWEGVEAGPAQAQPDTTPITPVRPGFVQRVEERVPPPQPVARKPLWEGVQASGPQVQPPIEPIIPQEPPWVVRNRNKVPSEPVATEQSAAQPEIPSEDGLLEKLAASVENPKAKPPVPEPVVAMGSSAKEAAQISKAIKIADFIKAQKISADEFEAMVKARPTLWKEISSANGFKDVPSAETEAMIWNNLRRPPASRMDKLLVKDTEPPPRKSPYGAGPSSNKPNPF